MGAGREPLKTVDCGGLLIFKDAPAKAAKSGDSPVAIGEFGGLKMHKNEHIKKEHKPAVSAVLKS